VVSDAVSGWHCVIYMRVRDGGGFIAVLDRISLATRVVGDFTFSCAFFISFAFYSYFYLVALLLSNSYNQLKRRATVGAPDKPLSASQYLLYSAEASSHLIYVVWFSPILADFTVFLVVKAQ
jgi:hypothetical protein